MLRKIFPFIIGFGSASLPEASAKAQPETLSKQLHPPKRKRETSIPDREKKKMQSKDEERSSKKIKLSDAKWDEICEYVQSESKAPHQRNKRKLKEYLKYALQYEEEYGKGDIDESKEWHLTAMYLVASLNAMLVGTVNVTDDSDSEKKVSIAEEPRNYAQEAMKRYIILNNAKFKNAIINERELQKIAELIKQTTEVSLPHPAPLLEQWKRVAKNVDPISPEDLAEKWRLVTVESKETQIATLQPDLIVAYPTEDMYLHASHLTTQKLITGDSWKKVNAAVESMNASIAANKIGVHRVTCDSAMQARGKIIAGETHTQTYIQQMEGIGKLAEELAYPLPADEQADSMINEFTMPAVYQYFGMGAECVDLALRMKSPFYVMGRPPGHHCPGDEAAGFCFGNTVFTVVRQFISKGKNVVIIDIDNHQGDGTQALLKNKETEKYLQGRREKIHMIDVNHAKAYPFDPKKAMERHSTFLNKSGNVCIRNHSILDDKSKEKKETPSERVMRYISEDLKTILSTGEKIDAVLISCGFDGHQDDKLSSGANLGLEDSFYTELVPKVSKILTQIEVIGAVLEGGYNVDTIRRLAGPVGLSLANWHRAKTHLTSSEHTEKKSVKGIGKLKTKHSVERPGFFNVNSEHLPQQQLPTRSGLFGFSRQTSV